MKRYFALLLISAGMAHAQVGGVPLTGGGGGTSNNVNAPTAANQIPVSTGAGSNYAPQTLGTPVTTVASSGATQTLAFASAGDIAYDVTLSANCTFSITAPTNNSTFRRIYLVIRPAGFTATLPASSSSLAWAGGSAPVPSTSAVTFITLGSTGVAPILGGI